MRISFTDEEMAVLLAAISEFAEGVRGEDDDNGWLDSAGRDALETAELLIRRARRKARA